jgi:hypothetical protein
MSQVGPTENRAGASSGPEFDQGAWAPVFSDFFENAPWKAAPAPAEGAQTTSTTVYEAATPNYTPIAIAAAVGLLALAWGVSR